MLFIAISQPQSQVQKPTLRFRPPLGQNKKGAVPPRKPELTHLSAATVEAWRHGCEMYISTTSIGRCCDLRRRVVCELRSPSVLLGIDILAAYPTTG